MNLNTMRPNPRLTKFATKVNVFRKLFSLSYNKTNSVLFFFLNKLKEELNSYDWFVLQPIQHSRKQIQMSNRYTHKFYFYFGSFDIWLGNSRIWLQILPHTMEFFALFLSNILPYLVLNLSERYPMVGVANPSVICPTKNMVVADGVFTTLFK